MNRHDTLIMVFAKAPVPGHVKTRLGRDLGMCLASRLYQRWLYEFLSGLSAACNARLQLWCHPDTRHPFFLKCARELGVGLRRQTGGDLGARMHAALRANRHIRYKVLVGADLPTIAPAVIEQAVEKLQNGMELVLLPTLDGGYGLIAMKAEHPQLFINMAWSNSKVCGRTLSRARRQRLGVALLKCHSDIDTKQDYIAYRRGC